jgi:transposase
MKASPSFYCRFKHYFEMEREILKKATVDSTCQRNTIFNYLFWCFKAQTLSWPII